MAVYHLSAQFPGPTTPRDFVTLLLTSSFALNESESLASRPASPPSDGDKTSPRRFTDTPRHFVVISRPCIHPDCPPRDGFIRGQYESVEFIREIPKKSKKASSTTDLSKLLQTQDDTPPLEKETILRNAERKLKESRQDFVAGNGQLTAAAADEVAKEGRKRGKTISFAGSRGASAKGEAMDDPDAHDDAETNPVEWIMITRSDPGGSVPRFIIERGTPGGIVADASKFLDWACKKEHPQDEVEALETGDLDHIQKKTREELEAYDTNGHSAGLDGEAPGVEAPTPAVPRGTNMEMATAPGDPAHQRGLVATVTNAAYAGLESYAPQIVIDRLPGHQSMQSIDGVTGDLNDTSASPSRTISSVSSTVSFASAEDHFDDTLSTETATSQTKSPNATDAAAMSPQEKELAKLTERKKKLDESLAKAREKELKDKESLTSREEERLKKAEEKHAKEVAKQEEKYKKEVARLEAKRQKEAAKTGERKRKEEDKDEKRRLAREKEEARQELEVVSKERDILREQVRALQRENTGLVARLGKTEEGKDFLKEMKREVEEQGRRSRSGSGSLRREKGKEATALAEKQEGNGEAAK